MGSAEAVQRTCAAYTEAKHSTAAIIASPAERQLWSLYSTLTEAAADSMLATDAQSLLNKHAQNQVS